MSDKTNKVPPLPKRVLIVSVDDPWKGGGVGGKHTHIRLLQTGLNSIGCFPRVVCVRKTVPFKYLRLFPGAFRRKLMKDKGARYEHYVKQYDDQMRRNLRKDSLDFKWSNPQDVIAANALGDLLGASEKQRPMVLTLHGYFTREAASDAEINELSDHYKRFMEVERKACERAWRIVCVDSRIRDYVKSTFSVESSRMTVIPNAVDIDRFSPVTDEQMMNHRRDLGLPDDAYVLLCPRRLVPKNGVSYAVKAMKHLRDDGQKKMLILAGDGPERKSIEELVKTEKLSNRVLIKGSVPHALINGYYAAADAVVIPSVLSAGVEEATSLSMLEGMASGKPVIVTDVGGLKETVRDRETGLIVGQANPEAIAQAIEELIRDGDLAHRLGVAARDYVQHNHSYLTHARAILSEYERAEAYGPP